MSAPLSAPPPRPFSVTLLALGVLSNASLNTARLVLAVNQWSFISGLPGASPAYLAATGLVWALAAWPLGWGLWSGKRWAARFGQVFAAAFAIYFWAEQLFLFAAKPLSWPENGYFLLIVTIGLLGFVFRCTTSAKSKRFFGVND